MYLKHNFNYYKFKAIQFIYALFRDLAIFSARFIIYLNFIHEKKLHHTSLAFVIFSKQRQISFIVGKVNYFRSNKCIYIYMLKIKIK